MKRILLSLLSLAALVQADEEKREVPLKEYNDSKVLVGKLALPFGTIVRVTCRSFEPSEEEAKLKGDPWERQVEITSIQGKPIDPAIRIEWGSPKELPKPPVGESIEVWAYETGSFRGLPDDLGKYSDGHLPQGHGFCFVNRLIAIRKVTPADKVK
ncbi:hypothetical protein [Luteolibacter soli]|uniref:DUF2155 domain-containing protein n=1 Tax=Luteolibacter soli TaxID=3135280 RepID=A0ABU9AU45_9BACT